MHACTPCRLFLQRARFSSALSRPRHGQLVERLANHIDKPEFLEHLTASCSAQHGGQGASWSSFCPLTELHLIPSDLTTRRAHSRRALRLTWTSPLDRSCRGVHGGRDARGLLEVGRGDRDVQGGRAGSRRLATTPRRHAQPTISEATRALIHTLCLTLQGPRRPSLRRLLPPRMPSSAAATVSHRSQHLIASSPAPARAPHLRLCHSPTRSYG